MVKKVRDIQAGDVHVDGRFISSAHPVHPHTVAMMRARTPLSKQVDGSDWWQARIRLNDDCIRMKVWFHGGDALVDLSAPSSVGHSHDPSSKYRFQSSLLGRVLDPSEYQADDRVYYPDGNLRPLTVGPTEILNDESVSGSQMIQATNREKLQRERELASLKRMSQIPVGDPYTGAEKAQADETLRDHQHALGLLSPSGPAFKRAEDNAAARRRMEQSFPDLMNPARIRGRQIFEEAVDLVEALESAQRTIHSAVCRGRSGDKHHTECTQATFQIQHAKNMGIK